MRNFLTFFSFSCLSFFGTHTALAQSNGELGELARPVLDAVMDGRYMYGFALALVLCVALIRRFGGARWPILASTEVAPLLILAAAFGGALATATSAGEVVTGSVLYAALRVAVTAAGSYAILKPLILKLQDKAPSWLDPLFVLLDVIFDSKAKAKEATIKKAEKAGDAAVKKSPAKGPSITFKDIE